MRVVVVRPGPHFSVADVARGWVDGLDRAGATALDFRFDDAMKLMDRAVEGVDTDFVQVMRLTCKHLEAAVYEAWPDVILVVSGFFTPPELLGLFRSRGHKVVLLATESPYEDDHQLQLAPYCDLVVLNDPTNIDRFADVTRATYIPHAYDPARHYRREAVEDDWRSDFCFVGTGYPSRIEFFEAVDWDGVDVALGGNWQHLTPDSPLCKFVAHDRSHCLENDQAVDLYSATKASANVYRTEAQRPELSTGWSMGPREVELAATGTFFLTESRPENRQILPMVPTFEGPDDFGEQLRWWLAHDTERERAAEGARAAVADRTFENHARKLLTLLED